VELYHLPDELPYNTISLELPLPSTLPDPRVCFSRDLSFLLVNDTVYGPIGGTDSTKSITLPVRRADLVTDPSSQQPPTSPRLTMLPEFSADCEYVVFSDSGRLQTSEPSRLEVYHLRITDCVAFHVTLPEELGLDLLAHANFVMHPNLPMLGAISWAVLPSKAGLHVTLACHVLELACSPNCIYVDRVTKRLEGKLTSWATSWSNQQSPAVKAWTDHCVLRLCATPERSRSNLYGLLVGLRHFSLNQRSSRISSISTLALVPQMSGTYRCAAFAKDTLPRTGSPRYELGR